ncbi:MAG: Zn-dependent hydrolase [Bacteroidales bacterium]|nr:MAG: Zn-dependent hydrolase [Bacteroidales bacterium]
MINKTVGILLIFLIIIGSCKRSSYNSQDETNNELMEKINDFAIVKLTTSLDDLSDNQKKMIPILIEAAEIMDELFWYQAYGDKEELLSNIDSEAGKKLVLINYGPWERLNNNKPFIEGAGEKPAGANFYPEDMTKEEFTSFNSDDKASLYTLIKRKEDGSLESVPYHLCFKEQSAKASGLLLKAAELAEDQGFKEYLKLRAAALLTDDYFASDIAWMDMKTNKIDFIVGPIETYEDQLYGYKASFEAFILIKDLEWSKKLDKYSSILPQLQKALPVNEIYKSEIPGSDSDLGAYDAIYYAGDCNAGAKSIAINLPNDEKVQLEKGSRNLQLKNSMKAKFDKILVPIAKELMAEDQQQHITFDAFFANTMYHEVAHGLGIKNTINNRGTVREALKDNYTTIEEGKADILGLFLVMKLKEMGEIDNDLMDNYSTFMAGIFRSIRFGAASAHGKANLIRFNYFKEKGAFYIDVNGKYNVSYEEFQKAVNSLSELILTIQGNGDYDRANEIIDKYGVIDADLEKALKKIEEKDIPVDIVFEQGMSVLGL